MNADDIEFRIGGDPSGAMQALKRIEREADKTAQEMRKDFDKATEAIARGMNDNIPRAFQGIRGRNIGASLGTEIAQGLEGAIKGRNLGSVITDAFAGVASAFGPIGLAAGAGLALGVTALQQAYDAFMPSAEQARETTLAYIDAMENLGIISSVAADEQRTLAGAIDQVAVAQQALTDRARNLYDTFTQQAAEARAELQEFIKTQETAGDLGLLSDDVVRAMELAKRALNEGGEEAARTRLAILDIGNASPDFSPLFGQLGAAIAELATAQQAADNAYAAFNNAASAAANFGREAQRASALGNVVTDTSMQTRPPASNFVEERNARDRENSIGANRSYQGYREWGERIEQGRVRSLPRVRGGGGSRGAVPRVSRGGGGGGMSEAEREAKDIERQIEAMEKSNRVLAAEAQSIGKSNLEKRIAIELAKTSQNIGEKERSQIIALVTARESLNDVLQQNRDAQQTLNDINNFAKDSLGEIFSSAIRGGEDFGETLKNIGLRMAELIFQKQVLEPLFGDGSGGGGLFGGGKGGGNILSSLIGGLFGGFRAEGGPVDAGKTYMVGEKGPEMVRFGSSGHVYPNSAMRGGGGQNVSVSISLSGANGDATIRRIAEQATRQGVAAGLQQYNRSLTNSFGSRMRVAESTQL
jgi:hypothetical protein